MTRSKGADVRCELHAGCEGYPASVLELAEPPKTIYVRGDVAVLSEPSMAVIGSRRPTPYGITMAELSARVAAESGVVVVSGGAMGCDQAAGRSVLDHGGRHIMVLGTGADVPYPKGVAPLVERTINTGGAVISIAPWGTDPRRWAFPKRNAVIAALSQAVFITEAGMPSGTFSTAEAAMDLGREVLVVPGSMLSPLSRGSNYLISLGATCIVDEDSLEMAVSRIFGLLRYSRPAAPGLPALDAQARTVVSALIASPMRVEAVSSMLGLDTTACLLLLSQLTVDGFIEQLYDGTYSATKLALHAQTPFGHNG